jgi:formate dehydrogenase alpha subunit
MITLRINDQDVMAQEGQTVLQAAAGAGIVIPTLCYHPALSSIGSCRLCLVELEGRPSETPSCLLPAREGMVVHTESPVLTQSRRLVLQLLLQQTTVDLAAAGPQNELAYWAKRYHVDIPLEDREPPRYPVDRDPNPVIRVDMNQCILCTRCLRACAEIQGRFVWHLAERGHETRIVAGSDTTMLEGRCESCGACAAACPTDALADRNTLGLPAADRLITTTCGYCGVGCQFDLNIKDERVVAVTPNPQAPVNGVSLCVKGRYGFDYVHHPDRLTTPRLRRYLVEGKPKPTSRDTADWQWVDASWKQTFGIVINKLIQIRNENGPNAIGVLSSAKCTNEENYLVQKFARQVLGTNNVDHCARLCHSSTVAGLTMALGSGAMTNSMDDLSQQAAAMLVIGSNTTEQHPVFGAMLRQAVLQRGLKLVVADPRRIDLVEFAALHVRQRPGTDIALINGLMHIILSQGWHNPQFIATRCEGFEELAASLEVFSSSYVAGLTGVSETELYQAAELLATHKPMAVVFAMGITQHTCGVLNVLALANLQLLLGNFGVAGGGVNPLRGQNNVQGACDMGALPNVFAGYQAVTNDAVRHRFAEAWRLEDADFDLSAAPGLTVTEMLDAALVRRLRALYIVGEDLALTEPDLGHARKALAATEFLVLQEIFPSATAEFADVLLPGAAFAEKEGTFTNTERRVQLVRKGIAPPGQAKADWQIIAELGRRVLHSSGRNPIGPYAGWDYSSPKEIMREIAALTPSYAGVSHQRLARGERLQWPVLNTDHPGTPILHVSQFPHGRGRFHVTDYMAPAEQPDGEYPLLLTTGRVLYHWHGGELSRRSQPLQALCPEPMVEINTCDAVRWQVSPRMPVRLRSRRGTMEAIALVTDRVAEGVVFGNFHFPAEQNVNSLTILAVDPIAKIPEYKVCAVRIEPLPS